jgi:hypothetical protein
MPPDPVDLLLILCLGAPCHRCLIWSREPPCRHSVHHLPRCSKRIYQRKDRQIFRVGRWHILDRAISPNALQLSK